MSLNRFREAIQNGATIRAAADESVVWKKNSAAPDYGPLAQASKEAAAIMAGVANDQLAFGKLQYEESKPFLQDIARAQTAAMEQQYQHGKDYYDYQVNTFRPLEQGLVADAENFNTDAYRNELAAKAAADAGLAFNRTRQSNERAMASMGVNPNSGKYQALGAQSALGLAANRSAAMTGTRQQARDIGWAKRMDAAGLGRNLAGASTAAYGAATNAGNAGGQNFQAPGAAMQAAYGQYGNSMASGQNMQIQGLSNVLNAQTQYATSNQDSGFGGVLGSALGAWASTGFAS